MILTCVTWESLLNTFHLLNSLLKQGTLDIQLIVQNREISLQGIKTL